MICENKQNPQKWMAQAQTQISPPTQKSHSCENFISQNGIGDETVTIDLYEKF